MIFVYIILGVIIILFITVVILAIRKYNNEEVSKELEYVSENYNVDEINDQNKIKDDLVTNQVSVTQTEVSETTQVVDNKQIVNETINTNVQAHVDNTPPPVIDLKIPERTDEEIAVVDTAIKEEVVSESVEVKDNSLKSEESGEEVKVLDNSLKVEESGDAAVVIPEETPVSKPTVQEVPKDITDYKGQAFNNTFDGNTTINKDIKVESPVPKDLNKTEIWDMSEVRSELNSNEKN